jgi:hypothetical protein
MSQSSLLPQRERQEDLRNLASLQNVTRFSAARAIRVQCFSALWSGSTEDWQATLRRIN